MRTDGNNSNDGLTDSPSGAWRSIDYAAHNVEAGDVVRVQSGTHEKRVAAKTIGSSVGKTVTFVADGTVIVCGFDFYSSSYIRVIGFIIDPAQKSCTMSNGCVEIVGTGSYLEFWNNTIRNGRYNGIRRATPGLINNSLIIGNTFYNFGIDNGSGMAIGTIGESNLIAYNEVFNSHPDKFLMYATNTRWLNNYTHDFSEASSGHSDVFQTGSHNIGWKSNLIESHLQVGIGNTGDEHTAIIQNDQPENWSGGCGDMTENSFRCNVWHNVSSGTVGSCSVTAGPITRTRHYNNTVAGANRNYPNNKDGLSWYGTLVDEAFIFNNIEFESWGDGVTSDVSVYCLGVDTSCNFDSITYGVDYNLGYDPQASIVFSAPFSTQSHGQLNVNFQFGDYARDDFHLKSSSGAIGNAGSLTSTSGSGTGTTFNVVANAGGFLRGDNTNLSQYGANLVVGDTITVGTDVLTIASISGDSITVTESFTWADGEPVCYGDSPSADIGAYPYKKGGYDLTATYRKSGSIVTVTPSDASLVRFVVCYEDGIPTAVANSSFYICAVWSGSLDVRVYPLYASKKLYAAANRERRFLDISAPINLMLWD